MSLSIYLYKHIIYTSIYTHLSACVCFSLFLSRSLSLSLFLSLSLCAASVHAGGSMLLVCDCSRIVLLRVSGAAASAFSDQAETVQEVKEMFQRPLHEGRL